MKSNHYCVWLSIFCFYEVNMGLLVLAIYDGIEIDLVCDNALSADEIGFGQPDILQGQNLINFFIGDLWR